MKNSKVKFIVFILLLTIMCVNLSYANTHNRRESVAMTKSEFGDAIFLFLGNYDAGYCYGTCFVIKKFITYDGKYCLRMATASHVIDELAPTIYIYNTSGLSVKYKPKDINVRLQNKIDDIAIFDVVVNKQIYEKAKQLKIASKPCKTGDIILIGTIIPLIYQDHTVVFYYYDIGDCIVSSDVFLTNVRVRGGISGSPVIDMQNKCVIGILTHCIPDTTYFSSMIYPGKFMDLTYYRKIISDIID